MKTGELEWLMNLLGINPAKSELASMAQDADRGSRLAGSSSAGCCTRPPHAALPATCSCSQRVPGPGGALLGEGPEPGG